MKHLYLLIVLALVSCSSSKKEYAVINDFLEAELKDKHIDTLYLKEETITREYVINKYAQAYKERTLNDSATRQTWVTPKLENWPLDENDIKEVKAVKDTSAVWKVKDFKGLNYSIEKNTVLTSADFIRKHLGLYNYVLQFSKPIYNSDKSIAMFEYGISMVYGTAPFTNKGLIVMKKQDSKWIQISLISYDIYY